MKFKLSFDKSLMGEIADAIKSSKSNIILSFDNLETDINVLSTNKENTRLLSKSIKMMSGGFVYALDETIDKSKQYVINSSGSLSMLMRNVDFETTHMTFEFVEKDDYFIARNVTVEFYYHNLEPEFSRYVMTNAGIKISYELLDDSFLGGLHRINDILSDESLKLLGSISKINLKQINSISGTIKTHEVAIINYPHTEVISIKENENKILISSDNFSCKIGDGNLDEEICMKFADLMIGFNYLEDSDISIYSSQNGKYILLTDCSKSSNYIFCPLKNKEND